MAEMTDTQVGETLDYLGERQPIASQRLTTLPGSSAGGGTVAPPITGGGPIGSQPGQPARPLGVDLSAPGASPLALAIAALRGGSTLANLASRLFGGSEPGGGGVDPAAGAGADFGGGVAGVDEAAAAGADFGGGVAGVAGPTFRETVGQALPYVGAVLPAITSFAGGGPKDATQAANLAVDTAAAAAAPFTFGASEAASAIARGIEDLISGKASGLQTALDFGGLGMLTSLFGHEGSYLAKREGAATSGSGDLSSLSALYQTAAKSGDPSQILSALATGEGDRGAVRSWLKLPNDLAAAITGQPASGNYGAFTQVEWPAVSPAGFTKLLQAFAADPNLIASTVMGSGDVAYLPQAQAEQLASAAASDAQALLSFVMGQVGGGGGTGTTPGVGGSAGLPGPVNPTGPDEALGFASQLVAS
jgi:hypothetical protein